MSEIPELRRRARSATSTISSTRERNEAATELYEHARHVRPALGFRELHPVSATWINKDLLFLVVFALIVNLGITIGVAVRALARNLKKPRTSTQEEPTHA